MARAIAVDGVRTDAMNGLFPTIVLAVSLLCSTTADARGSRHHGSASTSNPDEAALVEHGHYTNKKGEAVHAPAHSKDGKVPAGASAKCRDGTYSFSRSSRGTCSRHGGVGSWL
jgi:Protein of unknown function (DUF3761)